MRCWYCGKLVRKMTLTIWLPSTEGRDVFTAKTDSGYLGCFKSQDYLVMTPNFFTKPLEAANAARRLKKKMQSSSTIKAVTKVTKKSSKIKQNNKRQVKLTGRLYTVEETQKMPLLRFQEIWVVTHGDDYVADCLNTEKKQLVSFTPNKEKAKKFKDHEEAKRAMNTLKGVVGPGFNLMRYWVRVD